MELVEFRTPVLIDGEVQYDENEEEITELLQGVVLQWGTKAVESENGIGQFTVVYVRETESGHVFELYPEEIKYL
jgi:DNA/RNA endonuclease YhcR with UshA esterase domain